MKGELPDCTKSIGQAVHCVPKGNGDKKVEGIGMKN